MYEKNTESKDGKVIIYNKISPNYTQVHVDGAFGGITTRGLINISFFAERSPIPKSSEFSITTDNRLGPYLKDSDDSKRGILREFDFGIYLDANVAKELVKLLTSQIETLDILNKQTQ